MLSINQTNLTERAEQVIMMPKIFKKAECTIVWLGSSYNNSDAVMATLAKPLSRPECKTLWDVVTHWTHVIADLVDLGICDLCERQYWHRLWVVQELWVSECILLMCGTKIAPWMNFKAFSGYFLPTESDRLKNAMQRLEETPAARMCILLQSRAKNTTFWKVILATQHLRCADIRDKAYAILGLFANDNAGKKKPAMKPDYTLSIPAFVNAVLNEVLEESYPVTPHEVEEKCTEVEKVLGVQAGTIFTMPDHRGRYGPIANAGMRASRLGRKGSGISLWWSIFYGHAHITRHQMRSWCYLFWQNDQSSQDECSEADAAFARSELTKLLMEVIDIAGSDAKPDNMLSVDSRSIVFDMLLNPKPLQNHSWICDPRCMIANDIYKAILHKDTKIARLFLAPGGYLASLDESLSAGLLDLTTRGISKTEALYMWNHGPSEPLEQLQMLRRYYFTEVGFASPVGRMSLLVYAVFTEALDLMLIILQSGRCDVNHLCSEDSSISRQPALHTAVLEGFTEIARELLKSGHADVNLSSDDLHETPLMLAAIVPSIGCLRLLLREEACDVNKKNKNGETALMLAVRYGNLHSVRVLLNSNRVDPNIVEGGTDDDGDGGRRAIDMVREIIADRYSKLQRVPRLHRKPLGFYTAIEQLLVEAENRNRC